MTETAAERGGVHALRLRLQRARAGGFLGAGVGVLSGVLLGFALTDAGESKQSWVAVLVLPLGLLGAFVGHLMGGGRLAKLLDDAAGDDIGG